MKKYPVLLILFLCTVLAGCTLPIARRPQVTDQEKAQATFAALLVETEIARSLFTATPTSAPSPTLAPSETSGPAASPTPDLSATPAPPVVTPQAGMGLYSLPELPDYVFQLDPAVWTKEQGEIFEVFTHTSIDGCRIEPVPGHGLGAPQRYFWEDWGRFRWEIFDYGANALVYPVDGAGLGQEKASFLSLEGYNRSRCRTAQEKVLANLMLASEGSGLLAFSPYLSPTPRAALEGFSCEGMPDARLRNGDWVSVVTNSLWLRSEPRADNSTKVRQYPRYAPVMIQVTGGPVCEKYVYWQVEVHEFGEDGGVTTGWMAEGDDTEYYLVKVK